MLKGIWRCRGRYERSWERLEDLEPIDRVMPETLALRLQLCVDLRKCEMGESILGVLACADDETHKITCADFLHAYARHLVAAGDLEKAKQAVKHAVELSSCGCRSGVEIVEDDALAVLWCPVQWRC